MKTNRFIAFVMAIACMCLLAVPAFAAEAKASGQITKYSITVTPDTGSLKVKFSINGTSIASKIGCESIDVYKKSGSSWNLSESLDESDTGMSKKSALSHANTITCDGASGVEYKVVVTVFAENSAGRDTRTKTVYVTGK